MWKRLLLALAALGLVFAVVSWIVEGVTPSWIVFPILLLVGLVRARRGGSSGTVWLGLSASCFCSSIFPSTRPRFPTTASIRRVPTRPAIRLGGLSLLAPSRF